MNGSENLRGVDYQVSYALLHLLQCLAHEGELPQAIAVEDLSDEGADMVLETDGRPPLVVQVKKLSEGYQWTLGRLAEVIRKFCRAETGAAFMFVSNGPGNRDVTTLKRSLEQGLAVPEHAMDAFVSQECSRDRIAAVLGQLRIWTRCYPSDDDADPAWGLRNEIVRTLSQRRFHLSKPLADVVGSLWNTVFEMARRGGRVSREDMMQAFEGCGLTLASATWAEYPTARTYYPHAVGVKKMAALMNRGGVMLVTGIGGTGKTSLLAETAARGSAERRPTCWVSVNPLLRPEDFVEVVAVYLVDLGLEATAERLRTTERMEQPAELARQIRANDLRIIVDGVDRTGELMSAFLELVTRACAPNASGALVLASRNVPTWWDSATDTSESAQRIQLHGLPARSSVRLLRDADLGISKDECRKLAEAVGGHPQSLGLICRAMGLSSGIDSSGAVELVRNWILARVMQELPRELREALSSLSIFDYPLTRSEANAAVGAEGPLLVEALVRRDLISLDGAKITMHDVIRDAAETLLAATQKDGLHRAAAGRIFTEIEEDYKKDDFIYYEKSMKWASHLEKLTDTSSLECEVQTVLSLPLSDLLHLSAIHERGFPFEFADPSLEATYGTIKRLRSRDLIEPWDACVEPSPRKKLRLKGFSFFGRLLVNSLCLIHGYSESIGYMPTTQFNYAYQQQWLICPWEHCIELFPLAAERHAGSCPVFGHDCPGGSTQANQCREADGCAWDQYQSA